MGEVASAPCRGVVLALILAFAVPASASSPEREAEDSSKSSASISPQSAKAAFESDIDAILSTIEKETPSLLQGLSPQDRARAISAFVASTNSGISIVEGPVRPALASRHLAPEQACPPGVLISSNRIFYLRLSLLNKASLLRLREECDSVSRLAKRPMGLVLDLRDCAGVDSSDALSAFYALDLKDSSGIPLDIHLAALVGANSSGSAEVLAAMLDHERKGLLIGAPTAGRPFNIKTVKSSIYTLAIPETPETLSYIQQAPLKPSIEVAAYPQLELVKLRNELRSEDSDLCLSRAVDLLVSLDAIKRKWKKSAN